MNLQEEILKSVELLRKGKVLLTPTDTIWGISCDATNAKAVQRIFKIKGREESKSMIILLETVEKLEKYLKNVPPLAYDLLANSRSPLTIVYSGAKNLAKNVIAKDGTIAIRIVSGEYCAEVLRLLDRPLVSTSANLAGQPTATLFEDINPAIIHQVDYVVEAFRDRVRSVKPSTIIKLDENGLFKVLRP
ncbi:MAG: threonylcarbamoyl-AMP synthase [Bacteroidetes bacterium HGW-Bacteroidetes-16]|jgi:L-threonylcarbamoyladenylate synthase|nr:MAG: threonylcarbamoyl-AMP synthase [Bacteroidetes bacterium HGW-Bacteroidetes-16]